MASLKKYKTQFDAAETIFADASVKFRVYPTPENLDKVALASQALWLIAEADSELDPNEERKNMAIAKANLNEVMGFADEISIPISSMHPIEDMRNLAGVEMHVYSGDLE